MRVDRRATSGPEQRFKSTGNHQGVQQSPTRPAITLMLIGLLKFTPPEAAGIQPLVLHSPLMSWMDAVLSIQAVSKGDRLY